MMRLIAKIFTICLVFFACCPAQAQTAVAENDIAFDILKWHFHHYPKSETIQWLDLGEGLYEVAFKYEDKEIQTTYLPDGTRLRELKDLTKDVPVSIEYYLDERYDKYKVQNFVMITDFSDEVTEHQMTVKTKEKGVVKMSFDAHLVPVENQLLTTID